MRLDSVEFDKAFEVLEKAVEMFYWPRLVPRDASALKKLKSHAILCARNGPFASHPEVASVLLNLAGEIELILSEEPSYKRGFEPGPREHRLSAASCFALANNWKSAEPLFLELEEEFEGEEGPRRVKELMESQRAVAEPQLPLLGNAFKNHRLEEVVSKAWGLMGKVPPDWSLWPLARALERLGRESEAKTVFRLLTIAMPNHLSFRIMAATLDPDARVLEHAEYIGEAFPTDAYAQAFAGYTLSNGERLEEAKVYGGRGWQLARMQLPGPIIVNNPQLAYVAMASASIHRKLGDREQAHTILEYATSRLASTALLVYRALLLAEDSQATAAMDVLTLAMRATGGLLVREAPEWSMGSLLLAALQIERDGVTDEAINHLRGVLEHEQSEASLVSELALGLLSLSPDETHRGSAEIASELLGRGSFVEDLQAQAQNFLLAA